MTSRYIAFYGWNYYPLGGADDFLLQGDSLKECIDAVLDFHENVNEYERYNFIIHFAHIYDTQLGEIVWVRK